MLLAAATLPVLRPVLAAATTQELRPLIEDRAGHKVDIFEEFDCILGLVQFASMLREAGCSAAGKQSAREWFKDFDIARAVVIASHLFPSFREIGRSIGVTTPTAQRGRYLQPIGS